MKIRDRKNLKLRKMGRNYMIVSASSSTVNMADVFTLNESAAYLMERCLEREDFDAEMLASWLVEGYGIDSGLALRDAEATIAEWKSLGLIL